MKKQVKIWSIMIKKGLFTIVIFIFYSYGNAIGQDIVDTQIALNECHDFNTFVLIISNENYKYEQHVPFALNDGSIFRFYCEKTLGISTDNIKFLPDATLNDMQTQLWLLGKKMKAFEGEARTIFYYSGHGMPADDGENAYLLPIDGNSAIPKSGFSTKELYQQLGEMPSRQTIVLLDACFSGARRDGQMLASSRGVAIKAKQEPVKGNMVVFSAAQGNETAYPFKEKKHGLFTYFILELLQQKGGHVSLGEMCDYVTKQVSRTSIVKNEKSQTPMIVASSSVPEWREWYFSTKKATKLAVVPTQTISTPETTNIHDSPSAPVQQSIHTSSPTSSSISYRKNVDSHDLGYAEWTGEVRNGKPEGFGIMTFKSKHLIDTRDPDKNIAQEGDKVEGTYVGGHLEQGTWHKVNGESELLLIGL